MPPLERRCSHAFLPHPSCSLISTRFQIAASWKCLTRSDFNHVAVVIETPRGLKFLLEAVSPKVMAWRLETALNYWMSPEAKTPYIMYRKLSVSYPPRRLQGF